MEDIYELRLYDTALMAFALEDRGIEGLCAEIRMTDKKHKTLLPLDMEQSGDSVIKWLRRRVIPKNRAFVDEVLKALGLSAANTKGIIDICKGLSLNDSYWVVPQGFAGSFSHYNLYQNRFSEMLALVAYTGAGQSIGAFSTSPELTTNGMLPKAWRLIEGEGIYLYKGGSSGAANAGLEPYSEYYACQIAQAMGLDAVAYGLEKWKGILASKCKLFTNIDTAFVPAGRVVRQGGLMACLSHYSELGKGFAESLKSMLVFDAVIYNEDRHFGNFGLMRDNRSGKILAPAPLFDHGLSLFNYAMKEDLADLENYAKTRFPAQSDVTFEAICAQALGKPQTAQLRKLLGFKFRPHPSINWPKKRLAAIEQHIQKRVRHLLD
jgi:hypothetical protein